MPHYLIQTSHDRRPYYTNIPFLAADFARWGHRVDTYPPSSLWVENFAEQERKEHIKYKQRARLILLWANEIIRRDESHVESVEEGDGDDVGSLFRDFIRGLVRFDCPRYKYRRMWLGWVEYQIPEGTRKVLAFYTTLLSSATIARGVRPPHLSLFHEDDRVDRLTFRFWWHPEIRKEHLYEAMKFVQEAGEGRMGELRWRKHGSSEVKLYVRADQVDVMADMVEQLPVYVSQEERDGEVPPPPYEEVIRTPAN